MLIGICGKPSSGKSTFFSAATMIDVPIAARPFTTIKPNIGTSYASAECVCKEFGVKCNPQNSRCENSVRLIPVTLIDVAGLVPGSHLGKGLGNQFLNDLMEAEGLIHIVDISGTTNAEGNPCEDYDPRRDIEFLQLEIDYWIKGILEKNWKAIEKKAKSGKLFEVLYDQLSGLKISKEKIKEITEAGYSDLLDLAKKIREINKPIILCGNKIDLKSGGKNYDRLKDEFEIIPACAEAELALRKAAKSGAIEYVPGDADFEIKRELPPEQRQALEFILGKILRKYGGTGVQRTVNKILFEKLNYIVVYPVEDEHKLKDGKGNILPDAYLMRRGSTAFDLAYKIHSDIGESFIGAIDGRTKKRIGKEYILKNNDVIKILSR